MAQTVKRMYVPIFTTESKVLNMIDDIAAVSPRGTTTVVLDFEIGCKAAPNTTYMTTAIKRAHDKGMSVLGYVPTCYKADETKCPDCAVNHDLLSMPTHIGKWFTGATEDTKPDGIFFDQVSNDSSTAVHDHYLTLRNNVKSYGTTKTVMLNVAAAAGFINDRKIFEIADILQTYESEYRQPMTYPPSYGESYYNPAFPWDQSRVYMLVGSVLESTIPSLVQDMGNHGVNRLVLYDRKVEYFDGCHKNAPETDPERCPKYDFLPPASYLATLSAALHGPPATVEVVGSGTGRVTGPGGMDCTTGTCKSWAGPGVSVTLTADPDAGMRFGGFSGACTTTNTSCTYTPQAGDVVTATFYRNTTALITVAPYGSGSGTVTSSAGGINCSWKDSVASGTCEASLSTASEVTLTAVASSGSSFAGFSSGTCTTSTATTCTFTPSAGTTYTPRFDLVQSFALAANSPTVATLSGSTGTNTITVTPASGFSSPVTLSLSELPAGATAAWSVNPVPNGSGNSTLTLSSGSAAPNTYPITVTGQGGGVTRTTTFNWTISPDETIPVANLTEAFDALDYGKWSVSTKVTGDSADARKGLLILTPAANTGAAGVTVDARTAYSLLESSATVNALQVVSPTGGINAKFMFHAPGSAALSEVVGFWYEGGTLYAYYYTHGVQVAAGSATYSPDAHAWWRIRHAGSTVYWETSRDRATWTVLGQVPQSSITFDLSKGIVGFNVKAFGSGNAAPGQANFTHLNIEPTAIALLKDPFTAIDASKWYVSLGTAGSTATASGGVLSLAPEPNNGSGNARLVSMRPYALTGSSIAVKVPQTVSSGNVNQQFRVARGPLNYSDEVGFWYENGKLYAFQRAHGSKSGVATLTYSSTTHAWWRIRESAGMVYWDTSADGTTWTQRASMSVLGLSFSPAVVSVFISANEWGTGSPAPGTAKFSNLNAP